MYLVYKRRCPHLEEMKKWIEEKGLLKESFDLKDKLILDPLKNVLPELSHIIKGSEGN